MNNAAEISKHHATAASCCDSAATHHKKAAKHLAAGNAAKAANHAVKADALVGEAILHTAAANKQHLPSSKKSSH